MPPRNAELERAAASLSAGREVTIRPTGRSMEPRVRDGDAVTLRPAAGDLAAGDIVLARVGRRRAVLVLHQVLEAQGGKYLIGNASGRADGWAEAADVLGVASRVERAGEAP